MLKVYKSNNAHIESTEIRQMDRNEIDKDFR